jgi:hypothetical protein
MHIGVERHTSQPDLCHCARKVGFPRRKAIDRRDHRLAEILNDAEILISELRENSDSLLALARGAASMGTAVSTTGLIYQSA